MSLLQREKSSYCSVTFSCRVQSNSCFVDFWNMCCLALSVCWKQKFPRAEGFQRYFNTVTDKKTMEYEETQMQWNAFDHIWGKACHDSEKYKGKKKSNLCIWLYWPTFLWDMKALKNTKITSFPWSKMKHSNWSWNSCIKLIQLRYFLGYIHPGVSVLFSPHKRIASLQNLDDWEHQMVMKKVRN